MLLLEVTGILSAPLGYFILLTGFCIARPEAAGRLTFGLLRDYALCSHVHMGLGSLMLGLLLVIHGVSAILVAIDKYASRSLARLLYPLVTVLGALIGWQIILL